MDFYTIADLVLFPIIIGYILLGKKEWRYRILRVKYRLHYEFESDGNLKRVPIKRTAIVHHSPTETYPCGEGDWIVGGPDETFFSKGRPASEYNYDDSRPRKIHGQSDEKLPPRLVKKAFKNDAIERTHKLSEPRVKGSMVLILFLLVVLIFLGFGILYYEQNTACAVHSAACVVAK